MMVRVPSDNTAVESTLHIQQIVLEALPSSNLDSQCVLLDLRLATSKNYIYQVQLRIHSNNIKIEET
jgi:hypothetical protein